MTIGFFAPLPIALMIPFMVAQSLAMMEAAGKGWQFGKRRISAMSNEEFNKLTPHRIMEDSLAEYKLMIPSMTKAFDESKELQTKIIEVMVGYAVQLLSDIQKGVEAALSPSGKTQIKNPFVASFLRPIIGIGEKGMIDDINQLDTATTTQTSVKDFDEFQQQTAEDKRRQMLRDTAQERADKIKHIQLSSITPKFTKPAEAARATKLVITQSIHNVEIQISSKLRQVKTLQLQEAKITSTLRALGASRNLSGTLQGVKKSSTKTLVVVKKQIQTALIDVGNLNRLLAKTKALL